MFDTNYSERPGKNPYMPINAASLWQSPLGQPALGQPPLGSKPNTNTQPSRTDTIMSLYGVNKGINGSVEAPKPAGQLSWQNWYNNTNLQNNNIANGNGFLSGGIG